MRVVMFALILVHAALAGVGAWLLVSNTATWHGLVVAVVLAINLVMAAFNGWRLARADR